MPKYTQSVSCAVSSAGASNSSESPSCFTFSRSCDRNASEPSCAPSERMYSLIFTSFSTSLSMIICCVRLSPGITPLKSLNRSVGEYALPGAKMNDCALPS